MRHLIRISDYSKEEVFEIFRIADALQRGEYAGLLQGKSAVMFFPESSIRTRVSFEKAVYLLGGQTILFPPEALDKKEEIRDVAGYLNNWADLIVVRHKDIRKIEEISRYAQAPVINAMTDCNHPCEILSDLYVLSKRREDFLKCSYLFCGAAGNIGLAWKEASEVMGFALSQCCPEGYEMEGVPHYTDIKEAVLGKDVICTDSFSYDMAADFKAYQITEEIMASARKGAVLNPCPPFCRGAEADAGVLESDYFVGYDFKKCLLEVQQAIMIFGLTQGPVTE